MANQTVFPYSTGSNGQLTLTTNSMINSGATRATSIIAGGTSVYITDAGQANTNSPGQILPFTVGGLMLFEYHHGWVNPEYFACGESVLFSG